METMDRVWLMLGMIPRYPRKIDGATLEGQLAAQGHAVSRRTIQRDLERFSAIFPLTCDDRSKPYGWSWQADADGFSVPGMEPAAALTLRLADAHLSTLLPPTVWSSMARYLTEAEKVLERQAENPLRHWPEKIRVIPSGQPLRPPEIKDEVLNPVFEALLRERRFTVRYRRRGEGEAKVYEVSPLGLVSKDRLFYLVATLWDYADPLLLLLHRMEGVELLDKEAIPPEDFSLDEYIAEGELQFAQSSRTMRLDLLVAPEAGCHLLETPLSEDQVVTKERDDRLRIKATVLDTRQLRWWLLGFGAAVEVAGPPRLRREMIDAVRRLGEVYRLGG